SAIAGPAVGGILIASLGYSITYTVDVMTFVVSLLALAAIRSMPPADNAETPGIRSIAAGLKFAITRPELIGTYVVYMTPMTFAMPMSLLPSIASGWTTAADAGWLFSAISAGSLITSVLSGWTSRVDRHGAAVVVAAALWGVAIAAFGLVPGFKGALVCLAAA